MGISQWIVTKRIVAQLLRFLPETESLRVGPRGVPLLKDSGFMRSLARIFHELLSRDHEDGRATWQPQGVGSEAYLNGTSQEPTPEDAREDAHIRGRSR
jgi:hypothetical protein